MAESEPHLRTTHSVTAPPSPRHLWSELLRSAAVLVVKPLAASLIAYLLSACSHGPVARTQWLLSYDGTYDHSAEQRDFYQRVLTGPTTDSCSRQLFDGVIFLGIRAAGSGRWLAAWMAKDPAEWAGGDDWSAFWITIVDD